MEHQLPDRSAWGDSAVSQSVLVVDDDASYRLTVSEILTEDGWEVTEAPTAEDALMAFCIGMRPNVLVSDIDLGSGMDGWTLGQVARARWPGLGVLFISGINHPPEKYRHFPSSRFLLKPFALSDLLTAVMELKETGTAGVPVIGGADDRQCGLHPDDGNCARVSYQHP